MPHLTSTTDFILIFVTFLLSTNSFFSPQICIYTYAPFYCVVFTPCPLERSQTAPQAPQGLGNYYFSMTPQLLPPRCQEFGQLSGFCLNLSSCPELMLRNNSLACVLAGQHQVYDIFYIFGSVIFPSNG